MKNVVVSNSVGVLAKGRKLILFPSRWTAAVAAPSRPFCFYPYELAYLSTLLKRDLPADRFRVRMVDPNILCLDREETIRLLSKCQPDYLIFEPSAVDSREIFAILEHFKRQRGTVGVVVGAFARAEPEVCAIHADYVVPGEYEMTVLELIRRHARDPKSVAGLPGLYPNPRGELVDPNQLPWPEDEDICRLDYTEPGCDGRMIQVYASRGCPLACTFCVVPTYYGDRPGTWRRRDPADVVAEIAYLEERYRSFFEGIFFNEESHNTSREWLVELCQAIIQAGLQHLKYDAMCVYYNFDDELLELMRRAGYYQIRFGIESFDHRVGRSIRKNVRYEKLEAMLVCAKRHGLVTYGTSMVGAPGSTFESDLQTHNLLCHLRDERRLLDKWQVSIATPQPGTQFYTWARSNGYLVTDEVESFNGRQAVVSYPWYRSHEIETAYEIFTSRTPTTLVQARSLAARREIACTAAEA